MDWFMVTAMAISGWVVLSMLANERMSKQQQQRQPPAAAPAPAAAAAPNEMR